MNGKGRTLFGVIAENLSEIGSRTIYSLSSSSKTILLIQLRWIDKGHWPSNNSILDWAMYSRLYTLMIIKNNDDLRSYHPSKENSAPTSVVFIINWAGKLCLLFDNKEICWTVVPNDAAFVLLIVYIPLPFLDFILIFIASVFILAPSIHVKLRNQVVFLWSLLKLLWYMLRHWFIQIHKGLESQL